MKKIFFLLLCLGIVACSGQPSTQKLRDVKNFSFKINTFEFVNESGTTITITKNEIKTESQSPREEPQTNTIKLTPEQTQQIKYSLDRIPLESLKSEYRNEKVKDGGGTSFDFNLDGKNYKVSYINYALHPNLEELKNIIEKINTKNPQQ